MLVTFRGGILLRIQDSFDRLQLLSFVIGAGFKNFGEDISLKLG